MQRTRTYSLAAICGATMAITALGAEPPTTDQSTDAGEAQKYSCTRGEQADTHDCEKACESTAASREQAAGFLIGSEPCEAKPTECLSFDEAFFDARPDPMALRPMFASELLSRFDADKDGFLADQEQTTAQVFLTARFAQHRSSMAERFDLDEDGEFSASERVEARQWLFHDQTQTLNAFVEKFDADQNESMCVQECTTAMEQDQELFFTVSFFEGATDGFTFRDGPELDREFAQAFEDRSEAFTQHAKAQQQAQLNEALASTEFDHEFDDGFESDEQTTDAVAEVETQSP